MYPCSNYATQNWKAIVTRGTGPGGTMTDLYGVIGDARVNGNGTCTGSVNPVISYVLPANMQQGDATSNHIVQDAT